MLSQVPKTKKVVVSSSSATSEKKSEQLTEEELDLLLDDAAVSQELNDMFRRGVAPSQVSANVTEAIRWQDKLSSTLQDMQKATPGEGARPWVTDLVEDLIAYEISPSNTTEEAEALLSGLKFTVQELENSGYGPEVRNFVSSLKAEIEILIEKLDEKKL